MVPLRASFVQVSRFTDLPRGLRLWTTMLLSTQVITAASAQSGNGVFSAALEKHVIEKCAWVGPPPGEGWEFINADPEPYDPGLGRSPDTVHRIVCRMHIVRRSDGSGGFDEALIPHMMQDLNYGFRDTPFVFALDPALVYVDNDSYYSDFPTFSSAFPMLFDHFESGVMSWYITPCISGCTAVAGTWIGPVSPVRGILMAYATAGSPANIVTPTHEQGHIFQAYHPYETAFGIECTSGVNCAFAGDLICDTPASPIVHGGNTTGTGIYYGNDPLPCVNDPPFDPNPRLYMDAGWAAGHILRNEFSPGEVARMVSFLEPGSSLSVDDLVGPDRPNILVDCDGNGLDDIDEILLGDKTDLGRDLVPDECQTFPEPGDLLVCGMNNGATNRPRYYDGATGAWRGDMWNGMTWTHQMRMGPDGLVYMARLTLIQRMDLQTGRTVDNFIDGFLEGAGTFVDFLFEADGNLLILDNVSKNIRRYDGATGEYLGLFASMSFLPSFGPKYMQYGPDGNIYVVGIFGNGNAVYRFNGTSGGYMGIFVPPGSGGLISGQGLLFHTDGLMYVSNGGGNSVLRYDAATGDFFDTFVSPNDGGLANPHSLLFGPDGHLYVASRATNSVKRYDGTDGSYTDDFVTAGSGGSPGSGGLVEPAGLLFVPTPMIEECADSADCADLDGDGIRDDGCVFWECDAGQCAAAPVPYADFGGANGHCAPDNTADANDRFHALNCFSSLTTLGLPDYPCEVNPPAAFNVDAAGLNAPCIPDGVCDGNDAFAALNAFSNNTTCMCGSAPSPQIRRRRGD